MCEEWGILTEYGTVIPLGYEKPTEAQTQAHASHYDQEGEAAWLLQGDGKGRILEAVHITKTMGCLHITLNAFLDIHRNVSDNSPNFRRLA